MLTPAAGSEDGEKMRGPRSDSTMSVNVLGETVVGSPLETPAPTVDDDEG